MTESKIGRRQTFLGFMKVNKLLMIKLLAIPFYFLVLGPLFHTKPYWDDVSDAGLRSYLESSGTSFWDYYLTKVRAWFVELGRPFFLALLLESSFFYLLHDLFFQQVTKIIFIFLSMLSVGWMLKLLTKKIEVAVLFLFLVPLFFSIQIWCDGLVAFGILLPVVAIFTSLAVSFYLKFETSKKPIFLGLSILMLICGLLTYEISIVGFLVVILLVARSELMFKSNDAAAQSLVRKLCNKNFCKRIYPYVLALGAYVILLFSLRLNATNPYDGTELGQIAAIPITLVQQIMAALPLNSFLFGFVDYHLPLSWPGYYWFALLFSICFFSLYYLLSDFSLTAENRRTLLFVGLLFLLVPALMISSIGKYQNWLFSFKLGYGYITLYFEYIGMCLILMSWLGGVISSVSSLNSRRGIVAVFSFLFSFGICFSVSLNYKMVKFLNGEIPQAW